MTHISFAHPVARIISMLIVASLAACNSIPQQGSRSKQPFPSVASSDKHSQTGSTARKGGGYYLDDGPGDNPPPNLHLTPDAEPKVEQLRQANMQPYVALGKPY
ncbi:MAG TPA: septal ring lytic transglycosylase RlpA family lipoprotein, partial [Nitrosomonas sp.]|nr:septal ring lytic transglycosylase RlpA family lipoprotein [Nitrosomonas sp.]